MESQTKAHLGGAHDVGALGAPGQGGELGGDGDAPRRRPPGEVADERLGPPQTVDLRGVEQTPRALLWCHIW